MHTREEKKERTAAMPICPLILQPAVQLPPFPLELFQVKVKKVALYWGLCGCAYYNMSTIRTQNGAMPASISKQM